MYSLLAVEKRFLAEAMQSRVPLFGVCLGSQLIAEAVGTHARRCSRPEIGWFEAWLTEDAADGFNVICNYYPTPFEDFATMVVPELQRRGIFRQDYTGKTLRDHLGLSVPENRYTAARNRVAEPAE